MSTPWPALGRDDRRDALVLQPGEQTIELGAQDALVGQHAEQGFDRVEHDALGANGIDRRAQTDEQPLEIVLAGLEKLISVEDDVLDGKPLAADQPAEIEAQRERILREVIGALLEAHEHAGLAEIARASRQELDAQQGLAGARSAADQRRTTSRQATIGDLVQPADAGRAFGQGLGRQKASLLGHSRGSANMSFWQSTYAYRSLSHWRC